MEQKVELSTVFKTCAVWFGISFLLQTMLARHSHSSAGIAEQAKKRELSKQQEEKVNKKKK
jgi:hypothetical protein